jgi:regulator of protease activity HflC (stomatin/prohibitin superfamily)
VTSPASALPASPRPRPAGSSAALNRLFKVSVVILTGLVVLALLFSAARAVIYKIHPYERGLHLRGGRFIAVDEPGWQAKIPLVDTVIIVKINERLGYVERIPAMTSDDVTMVVSLEYTYRVTDPSRFALEVDNPERIVFEFVQGKLRDVVNTKRMTDVMHSRAEMNQEVMRSLREKETQYGVQFITVQMQNASPPDEVVNAIKDRMVAVEKQNQAQAEAVQTKTLADAKFYAAQKEADAEAYRVEKMAAAEAMSTQKAAEAKKAAMQLILGELEAHPSVAADYLRLMTVEALSQNSKWILGDSDGKLLDLGLGK